MSAKKNKRIKGRKKISKILGGKHLPLPNNSSKKNQKAILTGLLIVIAAVGIFLPITIYISHPETKKRSQPSLKANATFKRDRTHLPFSGTEMTISGLSRS